MPLPPKKEKDPKITSSLFSSPHTSEGFCLKDALTYVRATDTIYAENDVPQPQPPVAFGFSKVKPEPIIFDV